MSLQLVAVVLAAAAPWEASTPAPPRTSTPLPTKRKSRHPPGYVAPRATAAVDINSPCFVARVPAAAVACAFVTRGAKLLVCVFPPPPAPLQVVPIARASWAVGAAKVDGGGAGDGGRGMSPVLRPHSSSAQRRSSTSSLLTRASSRASLGGSRVPPPVAADVLGLAVTGKLAAAAGATVDVRERRPSGHRAHLLPVPAAALYKGTPRVVAPQLAVVCQCHHMWSRETPSVAVVPLVRCRPAAVGVAAAQAHTRARRRVGACGRRHWHFGRRDWHRCRCSCRRRRVAGPVQSSVVCDAAAVAATLTQGPQQQQQQ